MIAKPTPDNDFAELMRAAQTGDRDAYERLLVALTPRIRRIVRNHRRFLQDEDIEDLVQDILLSVHAVRATYDPKRPFVPWLLAIARNRMVDAVRRYARGSAHEIHVENLAVTFVDDSANIDVDGYSDLAELNAAIRSLPPMQRDAIRMLKLNEMSLKEAADASHTTIGALKVATHRAMSTLRKKFMRPK